MTDARPHLVHRFVLGVALLAIVLGAPAVAQQHLKTYNTKYYIIHTDLPADAVREAELRITAMAEEYYQRTKGFGGVISKKFDLHLFSRPEDYAAAGGLPGTVGVYNPSARSLMAIARPDSEATWYVVQHEGFHQFLHNVVGGQIPIWINEGLADYFGISIYTGDGYVMGIVPPLRLAALKSWIESGKALTVEKMMQMPHELWNLQLGDAGKSSVNYDQAWSMVHFLAHGDGGRYQDAFNGFLRSVSRGAKWEQAWVANFGAGTREFEQRWRKYWLDMPAEGSVERYAQAAVQTLTSFYARAFSQKQVFGAWEEFCEAAKAGQLKYHRDDWLPPALLEAALPNAERLGDWQIRKRTRYELVCRLDDGREVVGTFQVNAGRVKRDAVQAQIRPARP